MGKVCYTSRYCGYVSVFCLLLTLVVISSFSYASADTNDSIQFYDYLDDAQLPSTSFGVIERADLADGESDLSVPLSGQMVIRSAVSQTNAQDASPSDVPNVIAMEPIVENGPAHSQLNIVFLGDGYKRSEIDLYRDQVDAMVDYLFTITPFKEYASYFNVYRVDLVSKDSGVDNDPSGAVRTTALDAKFNCDKLERALCADKEKAITAARFAPEFDQIIVLANSKKYGGSALLNEKFSVISAGNGSSLEVLVHELGHGLGGLYDEYDYGGLPTYKGPAHLSSPNISTLKKTDMAAKNQSWARWLGTNIAKYDGLVDAFKGANYSSSGIYRPTKNSKMKSIGRPFNLPSIEQLLTRFGSGIASAPPLGTTIGKKETVEISIKKPKSHSLKIQWFINNKILPEETKKTIDLTKYQNLLTAPENSLKIRALDPSPLISDERREDYADQESSRSWPVREQGRPLAILFTEQPRSMAAYEGEKVTFRVEAEGAAAVTYQWYKDRIKIPGATSSTYRTVAERASSGSSYYAEVTVGYAHASSRWAYLNVISGSAPPVIERQPNSVRVYAGEDVRFTVKASGSDLVYQWRKNGKSISGKTNSSLAFTAKESDDGSTFDVKVSNEGGAIVSEKATLRVLEAAPTPTKTATPKPAKTPIPTPTRTPTKTPTKGPRVIYQ